MFFFYKPILYMVRYYGRARQRVGSVNTNQLGLKMSGCPSKVGRSGVVDRYITRRSHCGIHQCGVVFYHDVPWKDYGWTDRCLAPAPWTRQLAGGVGRINAPRFKCGKCPGKHEDQLYDFRPPHHHHHPNNPARNFQFFFSPSRAVNGRALGAFAQMHAPVSVKLSKDDFGGKEVSNIDGVRTANSNIGKGVSSLADLTQEVAIMKRIIKRCKEDTGNHHRGQDAENPYKIRWNVYNIGMTDSPYFPTWSTILEALAAGVFVQIMVEAKQTLPAKGGGACATMTNLRGRGYNAPAWIFPAALQPAIEPSGLPPYTIPPNRASIAYPVENANYPNDTRMYDNGISQTGTNAAPGVSYLGSACEQYDSTAHQHAPPYASFTNHVVRLQHDHTGKLHDPGRDLGEPWGRTIK